MRRLCRSAIVALTVALGISALLVADPPREPIEAPPSGAIAKPKTVTVFKTKAGKKYHCEDCGSVWRSVIVDGEKLWDFRGIAVELEQAKRDGLDPCSKCLPPLSPTRAEWKKIIGKVVGITDGDTLTVLDTAKAEHTIRLEGIDAPENRQAFGDRAKRILSDKVFGKDVRVEWLWKDWPGRRTLGHVYVGDRWINLELVEEGFAWHFTKYSKDQRLADAEKAAREKKLGLWTDKEPISPWDWRNK